MIGRRRIFLDNDGIDAEPVKQKSHGETDGPAAYDEDRSASMWFRCNAH
jgi:hypothetical protein